MPVETDDLELFQDLVPEDSISMYGMRFICYVDPDGVTHHDWAVAGDVRVGEIVGAIEVAKYQLLAQIHEEETEDD